MNDSLLVVLLVSGVTFGTPLALAAIGETIAERAGVLNIGLEGTMLLGAVTGFWATSATGISLLGFLTAIGVGALVGLVFAVAAVRLGVNQIVLGLALFLTGLGVSTYLGDAAGLTGTRSPDPLRPLLTGGITDWPVVGPVVFHQDLLVYLSVVLAGVASFYLYRTRPGLALRAVGDDPWAADTYGIRVERMRIVHVIIGSAMAGLAGSYVSLALIPAWTPGLTAGSGWIALALVILGSWRPWRVLFAAYVFGAATRLAFTLQVRGVGVPAELLDMLPYLLAFAALVAVSIGDRSRGGSPKSLGQPYTRGS